MSPLDPLAGDDLNRLGDIMTRVRDHMRAQPPRSTAVRKRGKDTAPGPETRPRRGIMSAHGQGT
jgi:hypothetical protein